MKGQAIAAWTINLVIVAMMIGGLFSLWVFFTPWSQVPWERREHWESWCKRRSECFALVSGESDQYEACWHECADNLERVWQRSGHVPRETDY